MNKKITLIGAGAVGTAALYSLIGRGIASEFNIIDINKSRAEGDALDLEDAAFAIGNPVKIYTGDYNKVSDSDLIIITAGRPQKQGETRLEMVEENAVIMKDIALKIKESGYNGVVLIASNPVDIMTHVFAEVTGFDTNKVISTGTELDSVRLRAEMTRQFKTDFSKSDVHVMGEHGDSSVTVTDKAVVNGQTIIDMISEQCSQELLQGAVCNKAYWIIDRKGSTYFGIGAVIAKISDSILNDKKYRFNVSTLNKGENTERELYFGAPSIVGANGVEKRISVDLSERELKNLHKSIDIIEESTKVALNRIK